MRLHATNAKSFDLLSEGTKNNEAEWHQRPQRQARPQLRCNRRTKVSIDRSETIIRGNWEMVNGRMIEDGVCRRIRSLIEVSLQQVAVSKDGWEKLFLDPSDGRYWELSYPESKMHGGGPPTLRLASVETILQKCGVASKY